MPGRRSQRRIGTFKKKKKNVMNSQEAHIESQLVDKVNISVILHNVYYLINIRALILII